MDIDQLAWLPFEANLAGAEFSGRRLDWRTGFYVRTIDGLLDGGRVSVDPIARPGGPGAIFTPGQRTDERGIVIAGFAYGETHGELGMLADQFGGLLAHEDEFAMLSFRELGSWRSTLVARSSVSAFSRRGRGRFAPFELVLRAPDQRIYGDPMETSGWGTSVTVVNRGQYRAPVTVEVRLAQGTALAGYTITGPGGQVIVARQLASSAHHFYVGDDGALTVSGVDVSETLTRADRIEAPPGESTFTVTAGAEILVTGLDTFNP